MPNQKTILIVAANPSNETRLRLDVEERDIDEGLRLAKHRDQFVLKQQWATRVRDLRRAMQKHEPAIVHFCGHGTGEQGIVLEDNNGQTQLVSTDALAHFFELFADEVECVVLNACFSEVQAKAIVQHIPYVIGMGANIGDKAAIEFAVAFYDSVAAGYNYEIAHKFAQNAIELAGICGHLIPELFKKEGCVPKVSNEIKPYPGLKPMTDKDAGWFFGRDEELKELETILDKQRFVIVIGASGSGKSSLVWAGLLPKLNVLKLAGITHWKWLRMTPAMIPAEHKSDDKDGRNPCMILAELLAKEIGSMGSVVYNSLQTAVTDYKSFNKESNELNELLAEVIGKSPPDTQLLLFIDQFEELFTLIRNDEHRKAFIELLIVLMASGKLRVVATMRAEFLGQCMESKDFGSLMTMWFNGGSMFLTRPEKQALEKMLNEPANRTCLVFEPGLVDAIIKDTGTESGNLPLMAYALEQLYLHKCDNTLTCKAYKKLGGVTGAIAESARQILGELSLPASSPDVAKQLLAEVFHELVEIDEATGVATRRRALLSHWDISPDARNLIDKFVNARLLLTDDKTDAGKHTPTLEVAHEALFREWDTLKDWINDFKAQFILRNRLQRDTVIWLEQKEDEAYRWVDKLALEAGKMIKTLPYQPSETEARFLGPVQHEQMLQLIERVDTHPVIRASIGLRLAMLGDEREGVGIKNGLPDIIWCQVPAGKVVLDIDKKSFWKKNNNSFTVAAFQIAKYPITQAQFQLFIDAEDGFNNPLWWQNLLGKISKPAPLTTAYGNYPVTNVCWLEAMAYCRWLSNRIGTEVRLPTEWQWQQAACSGKEEFVYPWGVEYKTGYANINETYDDSGEYNLQKTVAVGLYPQGESLQGIADLSGNIWEWCLNEYDVPANIKVSGSLGRVVRGGSWIYGQYDARASVRSSYVPDSRYDLIGFRVCCLSPIMITGHGDTDL